MESKEIEVRKENEIVTADSQKGAIERLRALQEFCSRELKSDIDYGTIPGCGNKKVLFVSGAEKLEFYNGFAHKYELLNKIEDWDKGFFHYHYKCIITKKGYIVGEAIGSANTKEKKFASQHAFSIVNNIDKMAQKRAYSKAIITAAAATAYYVVDDEVDDHEATESQKAPSSFNGFVKEPKKVNAETVENNDLICSDCKNPITWAEQSYSQSKFKKTLCRDCQKKYGAN